MTSRPDPDPPRILPSLPPWAGDVLAAILVVAAAVAPFPMAQLRPSSPLTWVLVLLPAALLPLRRRLPLGVLAACVAIYVVVIALGTVAPGVALAMVIAMFGVANRLARRTSLIAMGATVVVVVCSGLFAAAEGVFDPRTIQIALTILVAAAAGDATRSRREYLQAMTERAVRAEQTREAEAQRRVSEERLRIARDLHDAVAHQISVISLNAGVASAALPARPERAEEALATIRAASRTVLREIGDLLAVLRADENAAASPPAPAPTLDQLDVLVAAFADSGLEVASRIDGDLALVPDAVGRVAYRVLQEGLTNAWKHGAGQRAHILLVADPDELRVVVTNPVGVERDPDEADSGGYGLVGLRERIAAARGSIESAVVPGGYRLAVVLPYPTDATR